jgi:cytochrome c-type biogenesis protein
VVAEAAGLGIVAAFAAGLISFLSPCVAPLVPGYLSLISGVTIDGKGSGPGTGRRVLVASLIFVAGFTLVFVTLGASASTLGGLLDENRRLLNRIAGGFMILMGLFVIGALQLPWLYRERRFHPTTQRSLTRAETLLLGMAFGFGWTPCIGPLLGSILIYTSAANSTGRGVLLLLAYSLGLGVPFVVVGVGVGRALGAVRWITRHYQLVSAVSGGTLMLVGLLFLTNRFTYFNIWAQRFYYQVVEPSVGKWL